MLSLRHAVPLLLLAARPGWSNIVYAGADTSTHAAWRQPGVVKPLGDADNIYGTEGYMLSTSPGGALISMPSYICAITNLGREFTGGNIPGTLYTMVDHPTAPGASMRTGAWYQSTGPPDSEDDIAFVHMQENASFRLGILVDNARSTGISPSSLRVRRVIGSYADSGLHASNLQPNLNNDWYFFDIRNAKAGDRFVISGINWFNSTAQAGRNGIGGMVFDAIGFVSIPEPAESVALLSGLPFAVWLLRRRRGQRGDVPARG